MTEEVLQKFFGQNLCKCIWRATHFFKAYIAMRWTMRYVTEAIYVVLIAKERISILFDLI